MSNDSLSLNSLPHVNVQITPNKGREFIASENLCAGTTLFHVYPYATAIVDSFKKRICARCLCVHPTRFFSLHCHGCDQVYYCSQQCYEQDNHYKNILTNTSTITTTTSNNSTTPLWICSALRKLATLKKVDKHEKSVAKLVLLIYWQREKSMQQDQKELSETKDQHSNNDEESNDIVVLSSTYEQVMALESHYKDWSTDVKQDWHRIQQFLEKQLEGIYSHKDEVIHLISKIESNSFGVFLDNNKNKGEPVARALFPIASLFNHDCNNNCEAEQMIDHQDILQQFERKEEKVSNPNNSEEEIRYYYPDLFSKTRGSFRPMLVRTIRSVKANDSLTISYIDSSLPVSARRQILKQDYYFVCQCDRCINELSLKK
ncbi:hypothetical protein BDA99DRAFT_512144 [Phascolomyces articulosus]|uniref:SET domain-containing protein n=1 Tax=Phascolomyces articulosus TaxID=60185 RepID=A0AAD5PD98_9FUNG|nr:hypothetical protein BDA99DRAFT_512144 [Phascolomyces articulosus]